MSHIACPSPRGTNHERLYLTSTGPPKMARDADPLASDLRNQQWRAGNDRRRVRRMGRDDAGSDELDRLTSHLQNAISDPDDLAKADTLLSQLLDALAVPDETSGEDDVSNDPEAQRKDPDHFQGADRRGRRGRMAGDQR